MLDVVVRADDDIEDATDVPGSLRFRAGGSAANTARAFASLGGTAVFIGAVGDDAVGGRLVASLRAARVTVHAIKARGRSGRILALIEPSGERTFVTDRGVADSVSVRAVKARWIAKVDALHLPAYSLLNEPLTDAAFAAGASIHGRGAIVSVDLSSRRPLIQAGRQEATGLLARVEADVLFGNEAESAAVSGGDGGHRLLDLASIVVVKLGSAGCRVLWRGGQAVIATKPIVATDTTGAGDAFDAGFLFALLSSGYKRGWDLNGAVLRRAALAGHRAAAQLLKRPRTELVL
jgi:sugar/nucleoside kinase (ribokinase family)